MTTSDWVLIGSTVFLGAAAFLTPTIGDAVKNWWYAPSIVMKFRLAPPACHQTTYLVPLSPSQVQVHRAYYLRLEVINAGKTQARRCEVVLETLAREVSGRNVPFPAFSPVTLLWGSSYGEFVDINPGRRFFSDFLYVPDEGAQSLMSGKGAYVDWPGEAPPKLGVVLSVKAAFFSQPSRLPPGRYLLGVSIYSENADTVHQQLAVTWSGQWRDTEELMFRECAVELTPPAA